MQRGVCLYHQGQVEEALNDFEECYRRLRGNYFIDYTQLGLPFQVYSSHAIFNIALCHLQLGDVNRGLRYINEALAAVPPEGKLKPDVADIQEAQRFGERAPEIAMPYEVSPGLVFRPQEDNLKNAERKDYLGQARVVAGVDSADNYTGFSGRANRDLTLGRAPKKADAAAQKEMAMKAPAAIVAQKAKIATSQKVTLSRKGSLPDGSIAGSAAGTLPRSATVGRAGTLARTGAIPSRSSSANASEIGPLSSLPARSPSAGPRGNLASPSPSPLRPNTIGKSSPVYIDRDPFDDISQRFGDAKISNGDVTPPIDRSRSGSVSGASIAQGDSIKVKCHYTESRFVLVPADVSFRELRERVTSKFQSDVLLSLKYKDEDGRLALMVNDDDLEDALQTSQPGRLEVWCFLLEN
nr:hypothetical protein HK105_005589 [Polyrhizophydium stewartii]